MTMRRIIRDRSLTPEEAARYQTVREQVAEELPELMERHQERMAVLERTRVLVQQLKEAREQQGLSLDEVTERTGMDGASLSLLESGQQINPTIETLARYAESVGKRLVVSLEDA